MRLFSRAHRSGPAGEGPLGGFTLVEMLIASVILVAIVGMVFHLIQSATAVLKKSIGEIESFQAARDAFDSMTRTISLASLNNYYDYVNTAGNTLASSPVNFQPSSYQRTSDLSFVSGKSLLVKSPQQITHAIFFQAPLGRSFTYPALDGLLNACGYVVEYNLDAPPSFFRAAPARYRYQLMEFVQPAENLSVYGGAAAGGSNQWFLTDLSNASSTDVHPIANNIVALIVQPRNPSADTTGTSAALAPDYEFDSRAGAPPLNQLPPVVQIIMVAIDENSVARFPTFTQSDESATVIHQALHGLFMTTNQLQEQADSALEADLQTLMQNLTAQHINYRVFQSQIVLRGAKM